MADQPLIHLPIDPSLLFALGQKTFRCHRFQHADVYFYPSPGTYWCGGCDRGDDIHSAVWAREYCFSCRRKPKRKRSYYTQPSANSEATTAANGEVEAVFNNSAGQTAKRQAIPKPKAKTKVLPAGTEGEIEFVLDKSAWEEANRRMKDKPRTTKKDLPTLTTIQVSEVTKPQPKMMLPPPCPGPATAPAHAYDALASQGPTNRKHGLRYLHPSG